MDNKTVWKSVIIFIVISLSCQLAFNSAQARPDRTIYKAPVTIEMQENKLVGLLRFMYAISGIGRSSNTMKAIYEFKREPELKAEDAR